ncbi:MAG TPA: hypothetical protein VGF87_05735 [Acidimicrobiales bacterium]|jgi:hypothetical protein
MLWLSWRLIRWQVVAVGAAVIALAIALAITGPNLVHLYDTEVAGCNASFNGCFSATEALRHADRVLQLVSPLMLFVPALLGIFWGAPLVAREFENGTHKLAWTQSGTRRHWMLSKVCLYGLATMVTAGLLSLMVTWWSSPLDRVMHTPFAPSFFDRRDLVPVGYAVFAFALGVTFGVLIRRTLPAMVATLLAFVAGRLAVFEWIRPHLMSPLTATVSLNPNGGPPDHVPSGSWVLSADTINAAGRVIGQNGGIGPNGSLDLHLTNTNTLVIDGVGSCGHVSGVNVGTPGGGQALSQAAQACVNRLGIREVVTYQPLSRYWPFQWMETGIFVILALALVAFSVWFVRRRLSGQAALRREG